MGAAIARDVTSNRYEESPKLCPTRNQSWPSPSVAFQASLPPAVAVVAAVSPTAGGGGSFARQRHFRTAPSSSLLSRPFGFRCHRGAREESHLALLPIVPRHRHRSAGSYNTPVGGFPRGRPSSHLSPKCNHEASPISLQNNMAAALGNSSPPSQCSSYVHLACTERFRQLSRRASNYVCTATRAINRAS